ncbi:MAG: hypothetical protein L3J29_12115 [Cyclobacteriaceae bacterium]|nr:hypothetical protein [Cyclobacteriaceae bacterium]
MKNLITTLFIISMVVVITQTVRHSYVRGFYNNHSVLDEFEDDVTLEIKSSVSLDSLLVQYEKSHNAVADFEKNKTEEVLRESFKELNELRSVESKYERAIRDWESKEEKTRELIVFWLAGFLIIVIGVFLYSKNYKWIGLSLILSGIIEMIWWSSPSITNQGANIEFYKLLNVKLIFSIITFIVLSAMWILYRRGLESR